jgi:hypothetical protein
LWLWMAGIGRGPRWPGSAAMPHSSTIGNSFVGEWKDGRPWAGSGRYGQWEGLVRRGRPYSGKGTWVLGKQRFDGEILDAWPRSGEGTLLLGANLYRGKWVDGVGRGTIVHQGAGAEAEEWEGEWRAPAAAAATASAAAVQVPYDGVGAWVAPDGARCGPGRGPGGEPASGRGVWRSPTSGLLFEGDFSVGHSGSGSISSTSGAAPAAQPAS